MLKPAIKILEPPLARLPDLGAKWPAYPQVIPIENAILASLRRDGFDCRVELGRFVAHHPAHELDEYRRMSIEDNNELMIEALQRERYYARG